MMMITTITYLFSTGDTDNTLVPNLRVSVDQRVAPDVVSGFEIIMWSSIFTVFYCIYQ